ncbi:transcriptional regulator, AraC family [Lachnospiraceae bacterium KM106-2]|nr:transcriptional regulator, AraC family [Lachnospiraceae bacterium KM106-2]
MFTITQGGIFSKHSTSFVMNRPNGLNDYLLLLIKSDSRATIAGNTIECKPNSVMLIKPNMAYSYFNPNGRYVDDWLHFNCEAKDLEELDQGLFHQSIPISNPRLLSTYINQILWEQNYASKEFRSAHVDTLFRILIQHIIADYRSETKEAYHPYRFSMQQLRLTIQGAPYKSYSIQEVAAQIGISGSYFQHLYKEFFHISFRADLINFRLDYAKDLLHTTNLSVEEIASSCGYASEVHFYRQFLSKTGITPGEFRQLG